MRAALALAAYRLLGLAVSPWFPVYLHRRLARGKEDPVRWRERLGFASRTRPAGPLIWIHAASVGETLSILGLVEALALEHPARTILLTTGTVTSACLAAERMPSSVIHQFSPVDLPAAVHRFFDHWRPTLILWIESELWPNLLLAADRRGIPRLLVNARMSPRSFARWRLMPTLAARLLHPFALCLAQSPIDARHFSTLGAGDVRLAGNLKFSAAPLPVDSAALAAVERIVGDRPRWLAASTHEGEEAVAASVHAALQRRWPNLLTVIVPRHPERGEAIAAQLARAGAPVARRAAGAPIDAKVGIYLADTLGELGLWFRLCPVTFLGKSLTAQGGQNPLEAAQLGCAILFGPHMDNFIAIAASLLEQGAARNVRDPAHLVDILQGLLADPPAIRAIGEAARHAAAAEAGALTRTMELLAPYLSRA